MRHAPAKHTELYSVRLFRPRRDEREIVVSIAGVPQSVVLFYDAPHVAEAQADFARLGSDADVAHLLSQFGYGPDGDCRRAGGCD